MYYDLMLEMMLLTCSFIMVKNDVEVMNYPGCSIRFPPAVSLVMRVSYFCGLISNTDLKWVAFLYFGLLLWKMNYFVSVPECVFYSCVRWSI